MADEAVSVLVVDDQLPFRRAARAVVDLTDGFAMVGEAASGAEALELVQSLAPALVLMDINMEPMNGFEATRRIVDMAPTTAVVLLSTYNAEDLPADASSCGAVGYVHKEDFGPTVLTDLWAEHLRAAPSG
jgi:two-component system, NarL family, invasion response regulator UvrY